MNSRSAHFADRDFDSFHCNDFIPSSSSRRTDFDRRFNDLVNNSPRESQTSSSMLFDRSSPNMWSSRSPHFQPHHSFMSDPRMSEIPIKVEKTRSGGSHDEDFTPMSRGSPFEPMFDERRMNGHHSSSSDSLNSRNSSENSSSKVHHIPIFIEGRNEPVSPMYRQHETVQEETEPNLSRTSSNASSVNGGRRSNMSSRSSPRSHDRSDPESPVGSLRRGRSIPITVESQVPFRQARPGSSQSSQQQPETRTTNATRTTPFNGPFVTKVPVGRPPSREDDQEERSMTPEPTKKKKSAIDEIQEINCELTKLKQEVENFSGEYQDKQFRYLEEMLTRLLIRLDNVEPNGDVAVRTARKATVNAVEACASLLETKGKVHKAILPSTDAEMKDENPDSTTEIDCDSSQTDKKLDKNDETGEAEVSVKEETSNVQVKEDCVADTQEEPMAESTEPQSSTELQTVS